MPEIQFIDQTIRDGQQSLWGMRMSAAMSMPALEPLDRAGYQVVDYTGGGMMSVVVRNIVEDPWESLREVRRRVQQTPLRAAIRGDGIMMGPAPDQLMDLWVEQLVANGIRSFWVFDVLFHRPRLERLIRKASSEGARVAAAVMFTDSPVHTDTYYAENAGWLASLPIDSIYLEDTAGTLTPERVRTLVPAIQAAAPGVPIEAHFHNTTGLAPACYVEAMRLGVSILHTAVPPLADSGSLPSAPLMLKLSKQLGFSSSLDPAHFAPVEEHFRHVAETEGFLIGGETPYDLDVYKHQIPGGMMGALRFQLADAGLGDRLDEMLAETESVRRDLGYPGMATPFAQFAGIQALLNLIAGERYAQVPEDIIRYVQSYYGEPVGPIDPNVKDRILSLPNARAVQESRPDEIPVATLRTQHGKIPDAELILRSTIPGSFMNLLGDAGPLGLDYPEPPRRLVRRLMTSGLNHASCKTDTLAIALDRASKDFAS